VKTIVVKTQKEFDALPDKFDEVTVIEIRSEATTTISVKRNPDSSSVEARGSSSVVARDSSSVEALDSSSVVALDSSIVKHFSAGDLTLFMLSFALIFSKAKVKHLADHATAKFCGVPENIERKDKTATVILAPAEYNPTFDQWLERGYVRADGITHRLVEHKKMRGIDVFKVKNFHDEVSFVVKKGDLFSHGDTLKKAKEDLKYKISSRDTSEFKRWKITEAKPVEDMIRAYRSITGACEFGVKSFCSSKRLKKKYTVKEVLKMTEGQYGSSEFKKFFAV